MTSIRESIRRLFSPVEPLPAGNYSYQSPLSDPDNYRLHLRLEPDGSGILIVNASTVLHLNQTAAEYAYYMVQNIPEEQAAENVSHRYRINRNQALEDYRAFVERIEALIVTPDLDPVTYLGFDRTTPFSTHISAPYRLDCAITYRLPPDVAPEAAPQDRVTQELSTGEWKGILDKAWTAGIPHVIFTGGEPTLREDLAELIAYAESHGQVTGLMTNGLALSDDDTYFDQLLQTGLDHLTLIFLPEKQQAWDVLEKLIAADLFVAVHVTLHPRNQATFQQLLDRLAERGVEAISLSASTTDLAEALEEARVHAAELDLSLVWELPVPYSNLNPVALETEQVEIREGAGKAWLYIEPDGDVLPMQGLNRVMGNLLHDPWEAIWQKRRE